MKIKVEVDTAELKKIVLRHIANNVTGVDANINEEDVVIEVRSKQNYRQHEWEHGDFRAVLEKDI